MQTEDEEYDDDQLICCELTMEEQVASIRAVVIMTRKSQGLPIDNDTINKEMAALAKLGAPQLKMLPS